MRVGIDVTCWWSRRGFGRVTRKLIPAMMDQPRGHELCLFVDRPPPVQMQRAGVEIIQVPITQAVTEAAVASGSRSLRDLWAFTRATAAAGLDLAGPGEVTFLANPKYTPQMASTRASACSGPALRPTIPARRCCTATA